MKIPVLPISYADAQPFLANLEGPVAPEPWRGALPVTYHIGPGPATARLKVDNDSETRPLYNVIATIPGSEVDGRMGNLREPSRRMGQWRPRSCQRRSRRTGDGADAVRVAEDGLETKADHQVRVMGRGRVRPYRIYGMGGEARAGTQRESSLRISIATPTGKVSSRAGGSPSLYVFMREIVRDVLKPEKLEFTMPPVGSGSDYTPFLHHAGIASVNAGFGDSGGVYHSIYDSFDWYTRFSDKDFSNGKTLAQIMCTALMRMADAPVLPFEFTNVSKAIQGYLADLSKRKELRLTDLHAEVGKLQSAAETYEKTYRKGDRAFDCPAKAEPTAYRDRASASERRRSSRSGRSISTS